MKKVSTAAVKTTKNFSQPKLTIGTLRFLFARNRFPDEAGNHRGIRSLPHQHAIVRDIASRELYSRELQLL